MILLSHPTANDIACHAAIALNRAGVLGEFWTCFNGRGSPRPIPITPASLCPSSTATSRAKRARSLQAASRSLDRIVSARLASAPVKGVCAYEDGADESFRTAGQHDMLRIYNPSAAHWKTERAICTEEAALEPEWAATLHWPRTTARAMERRDSELHQADLVVVGSTFMLQTVERVSLLNGTVAVVPPGTPASATPAPPAKLARVNPGKLRALFVGPLTQHRGLSYLFRAWRELRRAVDLTVIGDAPTVSCRALERELRDVRWRPACSPHEMRAELSAHDVLLSPAIFDGFDPVMLDALAAGLPIIATPHTAAPDLVDQGVEGFIVPVRSSHEIAAKLELLRRDPDRRSEMSDNARRRALRHSWEAYERTLAASIATALTRR